MRTSPSCKCCGGPVCILGGLAELDTTISGSWTDGGTYLESSDAGAMRVSTVRSKIPHFRIGTDIEVDWTNPGSGGGINAGIIDANNYMFARLVRGSNRPQFTVGAAELGTETILARTPYDPSFLEELETPGPNAIVKYRLDLCYDSSRLSGRWGKYGGGIFSGIITESYRITSNVFTPTLPSRLKFGVSVAASHAGGGVRFSNLDFGHGVSESSPLCDACQRSCCSSPPWENILVELSGGAGECSLGLGFRSDSCTRIDGSYVLSLARISGTVAVGDHSCYWQSEPFEYEHDVWHISSPGTRESETGAAYLFAEHLGSGELVVQLRPVVTPGVTTNGCTVGYWRGSMGSVACDEWSDSVLTTLPPSTIVGLDPACSNNGMVCKARGI